MYVNYVALPPTPTMGKVHYLQKKPCIAPTTKYPAIGETGWEGEIIALNPRNYKLVYIEPVTMLHL